MSGIKFYPITPYLSYLEKCINSLKDSIRNPNFLHIEFLQIVNNIENLSSKIKQAIYNQLATLQTRIPHILLEYIFSYLNDDPILLEVCQCWNAGMKKILKKKHPFFIRRFQTGCTGLQITCHNSKLLVAAKNKICVFSGEGNKITTLPISVREKISNLKINKENKKIYVSDFNYSGLQVWNINGEYEKQFDFSISKCTTQRNKLFISIQIKRTWKENILEINMRSGKIINDWRISLYLHDLFYDGKEIFLTEYDTNEVQVFSEDGIFLRSWKIMDDSNVARSGKGISVHQNNVFISLPNAIFMFDRVGNYLCNLTLPHFLIPEMGLYHICIQNHKLYVSSEYNGWIYVFQINPQKKFIKKPIKTKNQSKSKETFC